MKLIAKVDVYPKFCAPSGLMVLDHARERICHATLKSVKEPRRINTLVQIELNEETAKEAAKYGYFIHKSIEYFFLYLTPEVLIHDFFIVNDVIETDDEIEVIYELDQARIINTLKKYEWSDSIDIRSDNKE